MKYVVRELAHKRNWVEVTSNIRNISREAWMLGPVSLTEEHMAVIHEWVVENQLGSRQSFNQWKLRSAAAVLAFKLKWG